MADGFEGRAWSSISPLWALYMVGARPLHYIKTLLFREKKMSRMSAIRVLDYAMLGAEGTDNCQKFVDILGLRSIYPLFMKTPIKKSKKAKVSSNEIEGAFPDLLLVCL